MQTLSIKSSGICKTLLWHLADYKPIPLEQRAIRPWNLYSSCPISL